MFKQCHSDPKSGLIELQAKAKKNGCADVKIVRTIDSSQGDELNIVVMSPVTTSGQSGFLDKRTRANIRTLHRTDALCFGGQHEYWDGRPKIRWTSMTKILQTMQENVSGQ